MLAPSQGSDVNPDQDWAYIVSCVATADSDGKVEGIGRGPLASLLHRASFQLLDQILKMAKRNHRISRCLSAARYYSGLKQEACDKIDALLRAPFPGAAGPKRRRGGR